MTKLSIPINFIYKITLIYFEALAFFSTNSYPNHSLSLSLSRLRCPLFLIRFHRTNFNFNFWLPVLSPGVSISSPSSTLRWWSLSLSLSLYIYIYIYICKNTKGWWRLENILEFWFVCLVRKWRKWLNFVYFLWI